jgi:hypothetical protein
MANAESAMLLSDCIVLFTVILVGKKPSGTCFHIHTVASSAWSYVGRVEKKSYPTPKQTAKKVAETKQSSPLKQTCGNSKTVSPT